MRSLFSPFFSLLRSLPPRGRGTACGGRSVRDFNVRILPQSLRDSSLPEGACEQRIAPYKCLKKIIIDFS